jgi:hypothetical protein
MMRQKPDSVYFIDSEIPVKEKGDAMTPERDGSSTLIYGSKRIAKRAK